MKHFHLTQHGSSTRGDALDLLKDEDELLERLFAKWDATTPDVEAMGPRGAVKAKWDHGTIGKLLLEHGAVWLAAEEDVARVLRGAGHTEQAVVLERYGEGVRPLLDRMAESSQGVQPISLAITPDFVDAVEQLRAALAGDLGAPRRSATIARLDALLGECRQELRSAKFIRKHAPTHPNRHHWFDHLPGAVRIQTAFDRLQGFPWGESSLGNQKLARRFDREA